MNGNDHELEPLLENGPERNLENNMEANGSSRPVKGERPTRQNKIR